MQVVNEEKTPDDLTSMLLSAYAGLIDGFQMESSREALKHTVVLIRNRGLSLGLDITVKEMASALNISDEELYAYINDEKDLPQEDLAYRLRLPYEELAGNFERVEIVEDINMIKDKIRNSSF